MNGRATTLGVFKAYVVFFNVCVCRLPMFSQNDTINHRYMPVLGNGHIGATVYHPYIYLNGLFNGEGGMLFGLYIKNFTETLII